MLNIGVRDNLTSRRRAADSLFVRFVRGIALSGSVVSLAFSNIASGADESLTANAYVLHAEPIAVNVSDASGKSFDLNDKSLDVTRTAMIRVSFDAFGRRFVAELESHEQLNSIAKARGGRAVALRGKVAGVEGSWIRLTQSGSRVHGMLWDGKQMIAIAPADEVHTNDASGAKTLIFRLADTVVDAAANSCAASMAAGSETGAELFSTLKTELNAKSATVSPSLRLQVSALMDEYFVKRYVSQGEAVDALVARANNVDGIFTAQLGIDLEVAVVNIDSSSGDAALHSATKPTDLLSAVSRTRAANPNLYATGITHLFTGRDLDGSTVGISYVGAVCSQRYGAALSEARGRDTWYESLIAAHEIGHSFGAVHDGEGECASMPSTYLMAPIIGNVDRFSQCSLDRMQRQIPEATCLTLLPQPDATVAAELGDYRATAGSSFDWSMAVANLGNAPAVGVHVQITMPPQFQVQIATVAGVSCSVGAGMIDCPIESLPVQAVRTIALTVSAQSAGDYNVRAEVKSEADANLNNNSGAGTILVEASQTALVETPAPVLAPAAVTTGVNATASEPQSPSNGGGGAFQMLGLLALLALAQRRPS